MDALRGSFGLLGSIYRARNARMQSPSRGATGFGGWDEEESGGSRELTERDLADLPRHPLYDPPVLRPTMSFPGVPEGYRASPALSSVEQTASQPAAVEEPGMDALRGTFGTVGSIIRARNGRMQSQSRGATGFGGWDEEESGGSRELTERGLPNLRRRQLYDHPVL